MHITKAYACNKMRNNIIQYTHICNHGSMTTVCFHIASTPLSDRKSIRPIKSHVIYPKCSPSVQQECL